MAPADVALRLATLPVELSQLVLCHILEKNREELQQKDRQITFVLGQVDEAQLGEREWQEALRAEERFLSHGDQEALQSEVDQLELDLSEAKREKESLEDELRLARRASSKQAELTDQVHSLKAQMVDQAKAVQDYARARYYRSLPEEEMRLRDFKFYMWARARQDEALSSSLAGIGFLTTLLSSVPADDGADDDDDVDGDGGDQAVAAAQDIFDAILADDDADDDDDAQQLLDVIMAAEDGQAE